MRWYTELGLREDHLRLRAHERTSSRTTHRRRATSSTSSRRRGDAGVLERRGAGNWWELEGIANRGDFDLTQHAQHSGEKLEYFDQATGERYIPLRDRARGGHRPCDARVPRGRLRRGSGRARGNGAGGEPHRAAPAPAPRAREGRGAAARRQGRPAGARPRGPRRAARPAATWHDGVRRGRARSAGAIAARTRSARRGA